MRKEEVYSWRVSAELKAALERGAREQGKSIAQLLEQLVGRWLDETEGSQGNEEEQQRLRLAAAPWLGKLRGTDPHRSERVRERVRARLKNRRAR